MDNTNAWRRQHTTYIFLLLATLSIDSFPLGAATLREFGARPTNILLAGILIIYALKVLAHPASIKFARLTLLYIVTLSIAIPLENLLVTISARSGAFDSVARDWLVQCLMFAWGIVSFFLWRSILCRIDARRIAKLVTLASIPSMLVFYADFLDGSGTIYSILNVMRHKDDIRHSGLASEPSIYGAWCAVVWPFILYFGRSANELLTRVLAYAILLALTVSAYLSNARTIAVVIILQLVYVLYWNLRARTSFSHRLRSISIACLIGVSSVAVLADRLFTLGDFETQGSNIARAAYTLTGILVVASHPIFGVGIGQFTHFFAANVPDFALASIEVGTYITGAAEYRASTFNLFVRLACEFGIPLAVAFSWTILRQIIRAPAIGRRDSSTFFSAISAVGGVGFWLSQDQYGYQPAIFAIALLSLTFDMSPTSGEFSSEPKGTSRSNA